jgi:uncharacterized membrane protein YhaH (DUF805 family)
MTETGPDPARDERPVMRAIFTPLTHCLQFHGRATRRQFWPWILFIIALWFVPIAIERPLDRLAAGLLAGSPIRFNTLWVAFDLVFWPLGFLATAAITVRRLHDTAAGGAWALLTWAPVAVSLALFSAHRNDAGDMAAYAAMLGSLLVLARCALPGTAGENRYGPDPQDDGLNRLAATFE